MSSSVRILKALAHPARLCVMRRLLEDPCCVNSLLSCLDLSQPNMSQHLSTLKKAGLIKDKVQGPRRCYSVTRPSEMKKLFQLLDRLGDYVPADKAKTANVGS